MLGLRVQGAVNGDHIQVLDHLFSGFPVGESQPLFFLNRHSVSVAVVKVHVEWVKPLEHGVTDAASCDGTNVHALEVVATGDAICHDKCQLAIDITNQLNLGKSDIE